MSEYLRILWYRWRYQGNATITNERQHKTNKMTCVPSADSDQPGHPPSVHIRVFAMSSMASWGPNALSCGQPRLWSDWVDAQADLSLHWEHRSFCWFCHVPAPMIGNQRYKEEEQTKTGTRKSYTRSHFIENIYRESYTYSHSIGNI